MHQVPYFAQWESPELISSFISGKGDPVDDPLWMFSGARSVAEYAKWSGHICGMACLKMAIAYFTGRVVPTFNILKYALDYGAYKEVDGRIEGMIYHPAVRLAQRVYGLSAEVITGVEIMNVAHHVKNNSLFVASVHPSIRWQGSIPPSKGGHLVLVSSVTASQVIFHNPSGDSHMSRVAVHMGLHEFSTYFAGRGIMLRILTQNRNAGTA